ncbi:MAG: Ig-like domain-containing protein, partial [Propionibacteriaceae bacterium]|nr:Ig-like domain-containing protein [Propionibacteriaceae bacterium]
MALAASMALAMVSMSTLSGAASPASAAVPGKPGVPQAPTSVFKEDFDTNNTPLSLREYPTASAPRYTADEAWLPVPSGTVDLGKGGCNGWIMNSMSSQPTGIQDESCRYSDMWTQLRNMGRELGLAQGMNASDAARNNILSASTNKPDMSQVAGYMIKSTNKVNTNPVPGGRFYGVTAYFAAANCDRDYPYRTPRYQDPSERFDLIVDGVPTTLATGLNPCAIGDAKPDLLRVAKLNSSAMLLAANGGGHDLGFRLYQATPSGNGNDVAFDAPEIIDMTPQLDQEFIPAVVPVGATSVWTFTITNTTDLQAKNGWSFSAPLPTGLSTAGAATTTCSGTSVDVSGGLVSVSHGSLNLNQAYCTVSVPVSPDASGSYTSKSDDITVYALNPADDATLSTSELLLTADVTPNPVAAVGDKVTFTFEVVNPDPVAVSGLTVSMSGAYKSVDAEGFSGTNALSAITCLDTTLPAHGATTCSATYTVSQADMNVGQVLGTAQATATATGATVATTSNLAPVTLTTDRASALKVTGSSPDTMKNVGDKVNYTFTVENTGNTNVTDVAIDQTTFTGTGTPPVITCTPTSLAPGEKATCTGVYTVTADDLKAKKVDLTAVATGQDAAGDVTSAPVTVTVPYVAVPDDQKSSLTVSPLTQEVGKTVVATTTILDTNGFPMSDVTVTLGLDGNGTFGSASAAPQGSTTCTTGTDGTCSVDLTDAKAETIHVTSTIDINGVAKPVSGSGVAVDFTAGPADPGHSTLELDRHSQTVGEPVVATVTLRDAFGNLVPSSVAKLGLDGNVATFAAVGSARVAATTCTTSAVAGPGYGTCQVTLTDTKAESVKVSAKVPVNGVDTDVAGNGDASKASPQTVVFTPGEPDPDPTCDD